jgi:hypothetical protein
MIQLAEPVIISKINKVLPKKLTHVREEAKIKFIKKSVELYRKNNAFGIIDFNKSYFDGNEVTIIYDEIASRVSISHIVGQIMRQRFFSNVSKNENVYFYRFVNIFRSILTLEEWTTTEEQLTLNEDPILVENIKQYIEYRTKMNKIDQILLVL